MKTWLLLSNVIIVILGIFYGIEGISRNNLINIKDVILVIIGMINIVLVGMKKDKN